MFSSTYGEAAISERMCREWFQRFKSGDFDVEDRHDGKKEKIFEDSEMEALFAEDSCQMQEKVCGEQSVGWIVQACRWPLKKPRLRSSRTGDPFSIRGSFSENMRSSGKQASST